MRSPVARALPQHVHLLPRGARTRRACGRTDGAFIRAADRAYLAKFLRQGGGLCADCERACGLSDLPARRAS